MADWSLPTSIRSLNVNRLKNPVKTQILTDWIWKSKMKVYDGYGRHSLGSKIQTHSQWNRGEDISNNQQPQESIRGHPNIRHLKFNVKYIFSTWPSKSTPRESFTRERKTYIYTQTCTQTFIAPLFIRAESTNNPNLQNLLNGSNKQTGILTQGNTAQE